MRIATWNMQGGTNTVYVTSVLATTQADVLCLQECGAFYRVLWDRTPLVKASGETIGYRGTFRSTGRELFTVYWENDWVQGSLAVMTSLPYIASGVIIPSGVPLAGGGVWHPPNPRWMPWVTVSPPGPAHAPALAYRIYSIHSPSGYGIADTCAWNNTQLNRMPGLIAHGISPRWICMGDFNADPTAAGFVAPTTAGSRIVRLRRASHQNEQLLDYAVTNVPALAPVEIVKVGGAADHYPQVFHLP